jgi:hypothetical protein
MIVRIGGVQLRAGIAACLLAVTLAGGAEPSTRPATTRLNDRAAAIDQWVRDLADTDPNVRDKARLELMGLDRAGLQTLRDVAAANRPLGPGQAIVLREIVTHVYLSVEQGEPAAGEAGFLGVLPATSAIQIAPAPGAQPLDGRQVGVAVLARLPGFCGYRMLEDEDVILRMTSDKVFDFNDPEEFRRIIGQQRAGETFTMDVLRRGKVIRVPITLDRKPAWAGQMSPDEADRMLRRRAAEYWDPTFAPLLENGSS